MKSGHLLLIMIMSLLGLWMGGWGTVERRGGERIFAFLVMESWPWPNFDQPVIQDRGSGVVVAHCLRHK